MSAIRDGGKVKARDRIAVLAALNLAFDLADKLVHAKDIQEVMALQADFLKAQMANIQAQTKELGETMQKVSGIKK